MPAPIRPIAYAEPRHRLRQGAGRQPAACVRPRRSSPTIRAWRGCSGRRSSAIPTGLFLAERDAGGTWRKLSYAEARRLVDALAQALIERGLSAERPVMILSGNGIDHALLTLAGHTAGIPVAPISVAYSLQSQDHAKLKHIAELLEPGLVYVADTAPFAKALAALDLTRGRGRGEPQRREPAERDDASISWRPADPAPRSMRRRPPSAPTRSPNSCSPRARPACPRASSTPTAC